MMTNWDLLSLSLYLLLLTKQTYTHGNSPLDLLCSSYLYPLVYDHIILTVDLVCAIQNRAIADLMLTL